MLLELMDKIVQEAVFLVGTSGRATLISRDIQTAARLVLGGELAKHAVVEGMRALTKFTGVERTKEKSRTYRAGLTLPVTRIWAFIKRKSRLRVSVTAGAYLAAVVEYIGAEILELAGYAARDMNRVRITPRHIMLAISGDQELSTLFTGTIPFAGVPPSSIHEKIIIPEASLIV